jgi:hypothetical protein
MVDNDRYERYRQELLLLSAKAPSDWIVLCPTADTDVVQAETSRFLFARKFFRVNLRTGGRSTVLAAKSQ